MTRPNWIVLTIRSGDVFIYDATTHDYVAEVVGPNRQAHAQLLVAGPRLLEACETAFTDVGNGRWREARDVLMAAIAQARSQTPVPVQKEIS